MDIAALVVSVLALLASGGSVIYTRVQAIEAGKVRAIESGRRHEELTPELAGDVEDMGGWFRLGLTLRTAAPLRRLEVLIVSGAGVFFPSGQNGIAPMTAQPLEAVYDLDQPLAQGARYVGGLSTTR